ncbi:MAG TPA: lipid-binding SYLF domain-containing protein [Acetobacteraceae bacterium]|nr:lipid-binding SYLF domain-containing protein [Acetobacteraceae bacterium]
MKRILLAVALFAALPALARAQGEQQAVVDRATLSVQEMMTTTVSTTPRDMLPKARAVLLCPRVFKAGFFFGGSGGRCVLLARAGNGTWSYPAFYTIGSLSFGLQIGVQDSALTLLVMTNAGLQAILNTHFKFGAGASLAIATIGGGVAGAVTPGSADIVAFEEARGVFAGISLEGTVLDSDTGADQAYYGAPLDARQIVLAMQGRNPGAEPLRGVLTRYGAPAPAVAYGTPPPAGYGAAPTSAYTPPSTPPLYPPASGYPAPQAYQPPAPGSDAIQQQNLPPPR